MPNARIQFSDADAKCPVGKWENAAAATATTSKIIHGATGITKALLHIGRAEPPVIEQRMAVCKGCPRLKPGGRCESCGCFVSLKTTLAAERCPEGKWHAVPGVKAVQNAAQRPCGGCGGRKGR